MKYLHSWQNVGVVNLTNLSLWMGFEYFLASSTGDFDFLVGVVVTGDGVTGVIVTGEDISKSFSGAIRACAFRIDGSNTKRT